MALWYWLSSWSTTNFMWEATGELSEAEPFGWPCLPRLPLLPPAADCCLQETRKCVWLGRAHRAWVGKQRRGHKGCAVGVMNTMLRRSCANAAERHVGLLYLRP